MSFKWSIPSLMVARNFMFDPDALAFFTATGITNSTIKSAVNSLVLAAKANGWWSLCDAIYPVVGGTADTHKYNLKDPQDTNGAFRITFSGTITHSSTGMVSNTTDGFGDTHLVPNSVLSLNDTHLSYYSRTDNIASNWVDMGCTQGSNTSRLRVIMALGDGNDYGEVNSFSANTIVAATTKKFQILSRTSSTKFDTYDNGSLVPRTDAASTALPNQSIYILAQNDDGVTDFWSGRQCAFASIGSGLTSTIAGLMNTDVQAFQATLGRAN